MAVYLQDTTWLGDIVLVFIPRFVYHCDFDAGWSSLAARRAHNPKVVGSNPTPATKCILDVRGPLALFLYEFLAFGALSAD